MIHTISLSVYIKLNKCIVYLCISLLGLSSLLYLPISMTRFDKISPLWRNFKVFDKKNLWMYLKFGPISDFTWAIFALGHIFIVTNGQYFKTTIWPSGHPACQEAVRARSRSRIYQYVFNSTRPPRPDRSGSVWISIWHFLASLPGRDPRLS